MQTRRGFTLIELMIVIAIVGILATMAVPTYQERVIRTQVTDALVLGDFAKEGVAAFYRANKRMPKNNIEAGLPPPEQTVGNFVTKLEVNDGAIHITMGNRVNRNAAGKTLSVRPAVMTNYPQLPIAWNCGVAVAPTPMKMFGENRTSLPPVYLPVDCRS